MGFVMRWRGGVILLPLCISLSVYLSISPGTRFTLLLLRFHSSGWLSSSGSEGKLKTHPGDTLPLSPTLTHSLPLLSIRNSFSRRVCCLSNAKQKLWVVLFFACSSINITEIKFLLQCGRNARFNALLIAHESAFLCVCVCVSFCKRWKVFCIVWEMLHSLIILLVSEHSEFCEEHQNFPTYI